MSTPTIRTAASGALLEVKPSGEAEFLTCSWLIEVASGNPEPSCYADTVKIVECGALVRRHPGYPGVEDPLDATLCDAGHDRLTVSIDLAPFGPAWQREAADRFAVTGSYL